MTRYNPPPSLKRPGFFAVATWRAFSLLIGLDILGPTFGPTFDAGFYRTVTDSAVLTTPQLVHFREKGLPAMDYAGRPWMRLLRMFGPHRLPCETPEPHHNVGEVSDSDRKWVLPATILGS